MAKRAMSVAQLRNLPQYRDKTDEELENIRDGIVLGSLESRIAGVIKSFEKDYDLSDMAANDMLYLEELAKVFLLLNDIEGHLRAELESEHTDWLNFEKINRAAETLRVSASRIQRDLNITRKARQDTKGQSVVDFIEDLKTRAKHFLEERLLEIYCPKCKMLLCKVWYLYPLENNVLNFTCGRERCGYIFEVTSKHLRENRNKNIAAGPPI